MVRCHNSKSLVPCVVALQTAFETFGVLNNASVVSAIIR